MRSIAVMNQKGGVGKTTTAVNLSAALAAEGRRVCLIDLDPQAHASLHLGVTLRDEQPSVYHVLTGEQRFADVRQQVAENLWLVPAHLDLAAAEVELAGEVGREVILRDKLSQDDARFDYLLVDCPPSLGALAGRCSLPIVMMIVLGLRLRMDSSDRSSCSTIVARADSRNRRCPCSRRGSSLCPPAYSDRLRLQARRARPSGWDPSRLPRVTRHRCPGLRPDNASSY